MKKNKGTQKNKLRRRFTLKKRKFGGKEPCSKDTDFDRFVISIWTKLQYELRNNYNSKWKFDVHKNKKFGSCNLWGWLKCHTSKEYDTHWDLYFMNEDTIGLALTFEGEHNIRKDIFNINYNDYKNIDDFVEEIADWLDNNYWEWVYELDEWKQEDCD